MGAADTLALWGIRRPEVTIRAAAAADLELAAACVVLMGESGGGRMVWGSDGAPTAARSDAAGPIYEFGGPVTRDNYLRFRAAQRAGRIPRQGVGDAQLTSEDYIARAEEIGPGPWDPYANQLSGFIGLAALMKRFGTRDGFVAYNGGPGAVLNRATRRNAAAEGYGDDRMAQLAAWRTRLGGITTPDEQPVPALNRPEEPMAPIPITPGPDGVFRATVMVEAGPSSLVVDRAWITFGSTWGGTRFRVCALDAKGNVMPGAVEGDVPSNQRRVIEIPPGAVMATVEGHRLVASSIPAAALVTLPKH